MKTLFKIARTELALLFYSPIAWFLLMAFLFQCGLAYTGAIQNYLIGQDLGGYGLRFLTFLTSRIFTPPFGIWSDLVGKLYLYLPLLTMGLMSREINSGTIKLLYSSPIKIREIVLGKFLAMMLFNLALVLILLLLVVSGLFNIQAADAGMLFAGLLGIYLLLNTFAAIGLFMSCLTSYQVVAALSTLVLLAVLSYVGTLWQGVDFVRDLTYFLSITGRAEHLLLGLVTTKDIFYFLVIIFLFLYFSIYKLQSGRESRPVMVKAVRYVLVTVFAMALGYISSRPGLIGYFDATSTKRMTLTVNAQKIIGGMKEAPIEVTSYINLLDNRYWYGRPEDRNTDLARWEPYLRFKPDIRFRYVYFYDSSDDKNLFKYNPGMTVKALAERYARSSGTGMGLFKTPAAIREKIDLRPEKNRYVMQLKYKDRTTFLRLYNDQKVFPSETETAAALKRLKQEKLPRIAFVQGELERSIDRIGDRDYKVLTNEITFRYSLVNQGFDVETVSLKNGEIPSDVSAVVIADAKLAFDTVALAKIRRYIDGGGNLLVAGEPGRQAVLNPILQPLGVRMMDGMLVQPSKDFSPDLIQPFVTPAAAAFSKKLQEDMEDSFCVTMRGAAALSYDKEGPFAVSPLVMTVGQVCWNKKVKPDELAMDSATPTWKGLVFTPEIGDQGGPLPAVIGLTRRVKGKEQRIVVAGDADFLSNAELSRDNIQTCNFDLSTALFSWFCYGEFPVDSSRPRSKDTRLALTDAGLVWLRILLLGILPGVLLVAGIVFLVRRKRK